MTRWCGLRRSTRVADAFEAAGQQEQAARVASEAERARPEPWNYVIKGAVARASGAIGQLRKAGREAGGDRKLREEARRLTRAWKELVTAAGDEEQAARVAVAMPNGRRVPLPTPGGGLRRSPRRCTPGRRPGRGSRRRGWPSMPNGRRVPLPTPGGGLRRSPRRCTPGRRPGRGSRRRGAGDAERAARSVADSGGRAQALAAAVHAWAAAGQREQAARVAGMRDTGRPRWLRSAVAGR